MDFIKPNKEKIRLYLFIIMASLVTAVLFMLVNRFFAVNYYSWEYPTYYELGYFIAGILRYLIIGYLTIALYKKKLSPQGEYYSIFKIVILLAAFSFLHQSVIDYASQKAPELFFTSWINIGFFTVSLLWYYLLACIIYYFDKK